MIDIPNAFIQTRIDNEEDMAIIKIWGVLVDMQLDITSDVYKPYVTTDNKRDQATGCTMLERYLWNNGGEPTLLPQVLQEFDKYWVQVQPIQSLRGQQDDRWQTNDNRRSC